MAVDVRMNYEQMEAMEKAFAATARTLAEIRKNSLDIAQAMEDGALLGQAGDTFRNGIRQNLSGRLKALESKMTEMSSDIRAAVSYTRDGVSTARNRFTN